MQIFSFLYHVGTISGSAGAKEKWGFPDRPALVKKKHYLETAAEFLGTGDGGIRPEKVLRKILNSFS